MPLPRDLDSYLRPTRLIPTDGIVKRNGARHHASASHRARSRAGDLRLDRRAHRPRSRGERLRPRRHPLDARDEESERQVRRPQRPVRRPGARAPACRRAICMACAWRPRSSSPASAAPAATSPPRSIAAPKCWSTNIGWIPVDPADVRKLLLEERPGASLDDPYVAKVRETPVRIVGDELDRLQRRARRRAAGFDRQPLPFLMYPQAEVAGARRDSLDPQRFRYTITAREV